MRMRVTSTKANCRHLELLSHLNGLRIGSWPISLGTGYRNHLSQLLAASAARANKRDECTKGMSAMDNTAIVVDQTEEQIFTYEASDEALERAACVVKDNVTSVTVSFCSGLDTCPA